MSHNFSMDNRFQGSLKRFKRFHLFWVERKKMGHNLQIESAGYFLSGRGIRIGDVVIAMTSALEETINYYFIATVFNFCSAKDDLICATMSSQLELI